MMSDADKMRAKIIKRCRGVRVVENCLSIHFATTLPHYLTTSYCSMQSFLSLQCSTVYLLSQTLSVSLFSCEDCFLLPFTSSLSSILLRSKRRKFFNSGFQFQSFISWSFVMSFVRLRLFPLDTCTTCAEIRNVHLCS